ncbi:MAG: DUF2194 domain-containing protein [Niameybacter sp.]|nr:DUF2194 domain-containing protein [Niameybacter sp.]
MLSMKRFIYVIGLVIAISILFLIYNFNQNTNEFLKFENKERDEISLIRNTEFIQEERSKVYVVGNQKEDIFKAIYENVITVLQDLRLPYEEKKYIQPEDLQLASIVIFCEEEIGAYVDLQQLENYINAGGKMILAGGIAEGYTDAYLAPVLGIVEKGTKQVYEDMIFTETFFPQQMKEVSYKAFVPSLWMNVDKRAKVYLEDVHKKVPLLYKIDYGQGNSFIINGTFLADYSLCGFLTGALAALEEEFIYPVMGVKTLFIDNLLMDGYVEEAACIKAYGRSVEAMLRDEVWPTLEGIALRNNLRYTASILSTSSGPTGLSQMNKNLLSRIGKSILQLDGELIYALTSEENETIHKQQTIEKEVKDMFPSYSIRGGALAPGYCSEDVSKVFGQEIRAIRGDLKVKMPTKYFVEEENYFIYPAATSGLKFNEETGLQIQSILATYGMISHVLNLNELLAQNANTMTWDQNKYELYQLEEHILKPASYLQSETLSSVKQILKSYLKVEYSYKQEDNGLSIQAHNFIPGQSFFYRTEHSIKEARGLTYEKVNEAYYLLRLTDKTAYITWE